MQCTTRFVSGKSLASAKTLTFNEEEETGSPQNKSHSNYSRGTAAGHHAALLPGRLLVELTAIIACASHTE